MSLGSSSSPKHLVAAVVLACTTVACLASTAYWYSPAAAADSAPSVSSGRYYTATAASVVQPYQAINDDDDDNSDLGPPVLFPLGDETGFRSNLIPPEFVGWGVHVQEWQDTIIRLNQRWKELRPGTAGTIAVFATISMVSSGVFVLAIVTIVLTFAYGFNPYAAPTACFDFIITGSVLTIPLSLSFAATALGFMIVWKWHYIKSRHVAVNQLGIAICNEAATHYAGRIKMLLQPSRARADHYVMRVTRAANNTVNPTAAAAAN